MSFLFIISRDTSAVICLVYFVCLSLCVCVCVCVTLLFTEIQRDGWAFLLLGISLTSLGMEFFATMNAEMVFFSTLVS